jgi:choline-sulfatase
VYNDEVLRDPNRGPFLEAERPAAQVVDAALAWLRDARRPFFLWVHLYDPHAPYSPPAAFLQKAGGRPYDGEVAYADAEVKRLLAALKTPAVIAVAGDHGEGLGEHHEQTHGMLAYDSTLRVPLVIVSPLLSANGRIADPVSLVDVPRTLLQISSVTPPQAMSGRFLLTGKPEDRDVYAETEYPRAAGWHPMATLADARWKLLLSSEPELYDMNADPGETKNVAESKANLVDAMSKRVRELGRPRDGGTPQHVDRDTAARLRSLGYVSGAPVAVSDKAPNPARVIQEWTAFERALEHLNRGRPRESIPALKSLAAKFPGSVLFEGTYARALMDSGHAAAALQRYRALVAQETSDAMLFHDLAVAARTAGQPAEALRAEQAALTIDKDNPAALDGLGLLHADAGRATEAAAAFARAAQIDPRNPTHWNNLGNAQRELGDMAVAEASYRRALNVDPNSADALNGLGVILVQHGSATDAIPLLTRAIERSPNFYEARLNLGIAYQQAGNTRRAAEVYRQLLMEAPASASRERRAATELLKVVGARR